MIGYKNQYIEIVCKLDDGDQSQYPLAIIKDDNNNTEVTLSLSHKFSGQYENNTWMPTVNGYYKVNYAVYSDSNHTMLSTDYTQGMETVFVIDEIAASSQIEAYGGGGGTPKSYISYTSKQGPWRFKEKEEVVQGVKDILKMIGEYQAEISKTKIEEQKFREQIDKNLLKQKEELIKLLQDIKTKIEKSDNMSKHMFNLFSDCDLKLKKLESMDITSDNIIQLREDVEKLIPAVLTLLKDEDLDKLGKDYETV